MKSLIVITFLIFGVSYTTLGQSFPSEKQQFIKYIDQIFSTNESEKVRNFAKDELKENILKNGVIDNSSFDDIVTTCNKLESIGAKIYPDIFNYLYSINYCYSKSLKAENIANWQDVLSQMVNIKDKNIDDYLKFSLHFFLYNKISDAGNSKWYYKGGDFTFSFDQSPFVALTNGNLRCLLTDKPSGVNSSDSIVISKTDGVLDILKKNWTGTQGVINWTKTGVSSDKMFASIPTKYKLNVKSSELKLDSVLLTAPYFKKPIYGTIQDQTNTYLRDIDRIYPRFVSYGKREKVVNIMEGIDFDGGFLIEGEKLIGSGDKLNPSKVLIKRNNKSFIEIRGEIFEFSVNSIRANNCQLKISIDKDSIYHNNLSFSYNDQAKEVELTRPSKGRGLAPFINSYHMLDMHAQRMLYKIGTDEIRLTYEYGAPMDLRNAKFESINYFDEQLFDAFKGQDAINPLTLAANYCRSKNKTDYSEGEFANALNKYLSQCKSLMLEMAVHGFITYNTEEKNVIVNDKLFQYADYKSGLLDFDNISFKSDLKPELKQFSKEEIEQIKSEKLLLERYNQIIENENRRKDLPFYGIIDLKTNEMLIDGVDFLSISNSQPTYIAPKNLIVKVKKNRDFNFDGAIYAGKLEIQTEIGEYDYSSNSFEIKNSKKATLTVNPFTEKEKGMKPIEMKSHFSNVTGKLIVDDTSNRAARKKEFTEFPKLTLSKPCNIFYNSILNGAYDSTRFFVTLEPFEIDSLDNFKEKALVISGELTSAGIFPKIKENFKIMDDYSFGFSTKAPETGYSFYGGNTNYKNKIILSANGLQGAGTINFLNSISESKGLTFLPDSTIGLANFVNNPSEEKIQFPDVYNERSFICYIPKSKILKASSTNDHPMRMFNNEAHLGGTIVIKESGMTGFGELGFKTATMLSSNYRFTKWDILADTSSFFLKNLFRQQGDDPLALKVNGVSANVSFKTRKGSFNASNTERIDFPSNNFYCQMDKFFWYMDGETVDMEKNKEAETSFETDASGITSNFYNYDPKLDNRDKIDFKAMNAKYDLKTQQIFCEKVTRFNLGDVNVLPDSNKLVVQKTGTIKPLINAVIEANKNIHTFEQCYIEISNKRNYKANGKYQYKDSDNEISLIQMDYIQGIQGNTTAKGVIDEKRGFKLSKYFDYFGEIGVIVSKDSLFCDGSVRVLHDCKYKKSWFRIKDNINPNFVQIPIGNNLVNTDDQPLGIGFYYSFENGKIYTTFLSPINVPEDQLLYTAQGYMQFNPSKNEFQISSKKHLKERDETDMNSWLTDNFLSLNIQDGSCNVFGEGEINLALNLGDVKVESFGTILYDAVNTKKTRLNINSRFSFPVTTDIMESIAKKTNANQDIKLVQTKNLEDAGLFRALKHWNDPKDFQKVRTEIISEEFTKIPKKMVSTMIISNIQLVNFGTENTSKLRTNSTHATLVSMYEKPVLKSIPFELYFEQAMAPKTDDKMQFNLGITDKFYYFDYQKEKNDWKMHITSDDAIFKKSITDIKAKQRKIKDFYYEFTEDTKYFDEFKMNMK